MKKVLFVFILITTVTSAMAWNLDGLTWGMSEREVREKKSDLEIYDAKEDLLGSTALALVKKTT